MREIKFRALSDHGWKYIDLTGSTGWARELLELIAKDEKYLYFKTPLEQFTGLKDRNGREIYEGDIVQRDPKAYKHVVEFRDGAFCRRCVETGYFGELFPPEVFAVIGNVHENPELLKDPKS